MIPTISILLLAAGASKRLGQPKQLLPFRGSTMIRHVAGIAVASKAHHVTVVIGSSADAVRNELKGLNATIRENKQWEEGLGSSIRIGVKHISPKSDAVLLMLCDQPEVTTTLLNSLIDSFSSNPSRIVACEYAHSAGVPALFPKKFFPGLMKLTGDVGAKSVLKENADEVIRIPFPAGVVDIDVPDDVNRLKSS